MCLLLLVALDRTFAAFARVSRPFIQESISRSPAAEDATIEATPTIRPFLANTEGLFRDLRPLPPRFQGPERKQPG